MPTFASANISHLRSKYFTAKLFHLPAGQISLKKAHICLVDKCVLFSGGEREIRTLGTGLPHTRFPVVRLRPAQPSLRADSHIISCFCSFVKCFSSNIFSFPQIFFLFLQKNFYKRSFAFPFFDLPPLLSPPPPDFRRPLSNKKAKTRQVFFKMIYTKKKFHVII